MSTPPTAIYTYIPTQMPIHAIINWHHQNARNSSTSSACDTTEANNTLYSSSHIPNSGSHLSQLSAPLSIEDRCSSISEEELEVDVEVTLVNRGNKPNRMFTHNSTTGRPMSTPTTMDYTTQGDPNQVAPSTPLMFISTTTKNQFLGNNNFFIPDGNDRHIHDIRDKVFHAGYLENSNNAYLLELPKLEKMLHTRKFLMDKMSGQFYAVYGNRMLTKPMLQQAWETGELIDQLAAMRQAFGYTKLTG